MRALGDLADPASPSRASGRRPTSSPAASKRTSVTDRRLGGADADRDHDAGGEPAQQRVARRAGRSRPSRRLDALVGRARLERRPARARRPTARRRRRRRRRAAARPASIARCTRAGQLAERRQRRRLGRRRTARSRARRGRTSASSTSGSRGRTGGSTAPHWREVVERVVGLGDVLHLRRRAGGSRRRTARRARRPCRRTGSTRSSCSCRRRRRCAAPSEPPGPSVASRSWAAASSACARVVGSRRRATAQRHGLTVPSGCVVCHVAQVYHAVITLSSHCSRTAGGPLMTDTARPVRRPPARPSAAG